MDHTRLINGQITRAKQLAIESLRDLLGRASGAHRTRLEREIRELEATGPHFREGDDVEIARRLIADIRAEGHDVYELAGTIYSADPDGAEPWPQSSLIARCASYSGANIGDSSCRVSLSMGRIERVLRLAVHLLADETDRSGGV